LVKGIKDLNQLPKGTIRFGIFTTEPQSSVDPSELNSYLGEVATVGSSMEANEPSPRMTTVLKVTDKLNDLFGSAVNGFPLFVTPLDMAGKTKGKSIPLIADDIYIIG
jgi:hypothetical protein